MKVAIESLDNQFDLNLEKLANQIDVTFDRFDKVDQRLDELASHFETTHDQLHTLYKVISSNNMQIELNMNGKNVTYESGLHSEDNNELNRCLNEKISTSFDNAFVMKFET